MIPVRELLHEVCRAEVKSELAKREAYDHRDYFGASMLGGPCQRKSFFEFRKATPVSAVPAGAELEKAGSMLRLFDRGHREEDRFIERLRPFFAEIMEIDPETGKQWEVVNCEGLFKGHMDGKARGLMLPSGFYPGLFLLEFKTHNAKSFDKIAGTKREDGTRPWSKNLAETKPEHYAQMQAYMFHDPEMVGGLYVAVNKDTDEWYLEFVERNTAFATDLMEGVVEVIWSETVPDRMPFASEVKNFYCRAFCDLRDVCYGKAAPRKSCRTCEAFRYEGAEKWCRVKDRALENDELGGCEQYAAFRL